MLSWLRLDPVTAHQLLAALRLFEGRVRSEGRALSAGLLELRTCAERSVAASSGQPSADDPDTGDGDDMHRLLDASEVALRLHVSERQVRRLRTEGQLPALRIGGRAVRYRPADVEALVDRLAAGDG